jgi:hypothetical protein
VTRTSPLPVAATGLEARGASDARESAAAGQARFKFAQLAMPLTDGDSE